jgi:hypothetical protein
MKTKELLARLKDFGYKFDKHPNFKRILQVNKTQVEYLIYINTNSMEKTYSKYFRINGDSGHKYYHGKEALLALYKDLVKQRLGL